MFVIPNEIIPYAFLFIFLIVLVAMKKTKSSPKLFNAEKNSQIFDDEKKKILEQAEQKLLALKDLYRQELIDVKVYIKKTELVASNLSDEMGENMLEINELQKKIVYNDLKKEIKKKIEYQNPIETKTNIDKLILAVDKKIKTGEIHEKKQF
tara:strand:+ start:138 stop:593 length:456 start_codon:yes stop_codon:yes gene_type:complete